jgi:hypothetical protein
MEIQELPAVGDFTAFAVTVHDTTNPAHLVIEISDTPHWERSQRLAAHDIASALNDCRSSAMPLRLVFDSYSPLLATVCDLLRAGDWERFTA